MADGLVFLQQDGADHYAFRLTCGCGRDGDFDRVVCCECSAADYDGDGRADIAVYRDSNTTFYSINSGNNSSQTVFIAAATASAPVSADYDGDGKADYAVKNGTNWTIRQSSNNQILSVTWQSAGDKPVQNDYDGDGKCDIAVWVDSTGMWYIRQSASGNSLRQVQWGISGDIPVPAFYRR